MGWKDDAYDAVYVAAYSSDPEARPVYRVPRHKPWWAFWRPTEWETIEGISRAQLGRVNEAMRRFGSR